MKNSWLNVGADLDHRKILTDCKRSMWEVEYKICTSASKIFLINRLRNFSVFTKEIFIRVY